MGEVGAVRAIVQEADRALDLRRVFIFGSRARGDARVDSDIDLAFDHRSPAPAWADFVNAMREQAPTLLDIDLIDLAQATPELRARILAEGTLLHG
jgi:predicted nucleotidyltransferase